MDERHTAGDRRLKAELCLVRHREMQQFGSVRRQQHLVGGDHRDPLLEGSAHPVACRIDAADHLDDHIGSGCKQCVEVLCPRH